MHSEVQLVYTTHMSSLSYMRSAWALCATVALTHLQQNAGKNTHTHVVHVPAQACTSAPYFVAAAQVRLRAAAHCPA